MVSSTFYDLRQVRAELATFITDDVGYIPLLSELSSFPVDPDLDTIENCRARVEKNADILILVIGGRYGSIDDRTGKSVTNLEFLAAQKKGIPIYAFVNGSILKIILDWRKNPNADFSSTVDTPKLFEFVDFVMTHQRVWTFSFESARDIIEILRIQFAHLFNDSLRVRLRLSGNQLPNYFDLLSPKALRIALERPKWWEYRLFLQTWVDETEGRTSLFKQYKETLRLEAAEFVAANVACEWALTRLHELQGFVKAGDKLLNQCAQRSFGPPGEPGNAEEIVWVSSMLGRTFENILKWSTQVRCARLETPFDLVAVELALMVDDLVSQFKDFPNESLVKMEMAIPLATHDNPQRVEMTLTFRLSNQEGFQSALQKAKRKFES